MTLRPVRHHARSIGWLAVTLIATAAITPQGAAQAQGDVLGLGIEREQVAYHTFVRPGEVSMEVLVLGDVRSPGLYTVGIEMLPDQLLALAGGVVRGSLGGGVVTTVTARLYRATATGRTLSFEVPFDQLMVEARAPLEDGDALVIEVVREQRRNSFDVVLRVLTTAASLFIVAERVFR